MQVGKIQCGKDMEAELIPMDLMSFLVPWPFSTPETHPVLQDVQNNGGFAKLN